VRFKKVKYEELNSKQKEQYNYQKISAVLAEYGFITIPLANDWNGADFLAVPTEGEVLKVQLKGRLTFDQKYLGKGLHICFRDHAEWFLYPHDEFYRELSSEVNFFNSDSWQKHGGYSVGSLSKQLRSLLEKYRVQDEEHFRKIA